MPMPKNLGGANFFNGNFKQTAAAQEETEIKNLFGISYRMSLTGFVINNFPCLMYRPDFYLYDEADDYRL